MEEIYRLLARRLREERKSAGLTLERLAESADITAAYVAHIEAARKQATLGTVSRLAAALNLSVSELLSEPKTGRISDNSARYVAQVTRLLRHKSSKQKAKLVDAFKTVSHLLD